FAHACLVVMTRKSKSQLKSQPEWLKNLLEHRVICGFEDFAMKICTNIVDIHTRVVIREIAHVSHLYSQRLHFSGWASLGGQQCSHSFQGLAHFIQLPKIVVGDVTYKRATGQS